MDKRFCKTNVKKAVESVGENILAAVILLFSGIMAGLAKTAVPTSKHVEMKKLSIFVSICILLLMAGGALALSNSGGGTWQYSREITINNSGSEHYTETSVGNDSDWPTYHHDFQRTGYTSEVVTLPLVQKWNFTTGCKSIHTEPYVEPAVVNGMAYWGSCGELYALNLNTGVVLWNKTLVSVDIAIGSPTVVDEIIYVVTGGGKVYALYSNGTIKWEYNLNSQTNPYSPVVYNNTVYIGIGHYWSNQYGIVALNADTGSYLWSYSDGYVIFDPAYYNGAIFAGSHGGILYSFNPATGAINWQYNTGGPWVDDNPSISNGVVYTTAPGTDLLAIDASNGNVLWTIIPNPGCYLHGPFATTSDMLYLLSAVPYQDQRNELLAIDTVSRMVKWKFGEKLWLTLPVVAGDKVITGSADNNLYFLDANNGTVLWQYNFSVSVYSVIASNNVVLVSAGNALYAFSGANSSQTSDLVGEWHFDGDANDSSGNGNNGTIYGATFVQGVSGQALSFDGV